MPFPFHHSEAVRRVAAGDLHPHKPHGPLWRGSCTVRIFNFDITPKLDMTPKLKEACTTRARLRGGHVSFRLWTLSIWMLLTVAASPLAGSAQGVVILSFLTGAETNVPLTPNVETLIWDFSVYPPASPNFQLGQHILSGTPTACAVPIDPSRCPDYWAVLVVLTPVTLFNDSSRSGVVTMTVYSDNAYVYQH